MNPDKSTSGGDLQSQGSDPSNLDRQNSPTTPPQNHRDTAANVIRSQIDGLYDTDTRYHVAEETPRVASASPVQSQPEQANPYQRNHSQHPLPEAEQWKAYHTAWQNYYQKYYEGYYSSVAADTAKAPAGGDAPKQQSYFSSQPEEETYEPEVLSKDEALADLRQKLLGRVQASAKKIRKSRHFIPIISALGVVLVFVFLQYNQIFIANVKAYVSPGNVDPQNIVVDPNSDVAVSQEAKLIIPKINVDVPVTYDVGTDYDSQMKAMANGLAHFPVQGASSHPGEVGNTVLAGHSSNDLFDGGQYKFIFAQLDKLTPGDTIYANYKGKRYTYVVTKTAVVKPTDVNALIYPTTKPIMTLITCTPLGTALNRLLVTAEQVSPDPSSAAAAPAGSGDASSAASIPGDSGTVFSRLFGNND